MTTAWREVAGEGIRVNGVRAGIIYTEIHADGGEPNRVDRLGPAADGARDDRSGPRDSVAVVRRGSSRSSFIDVAGGR
jgi:NAD(P)-dependent dehydrogenase (short-subunit alcohol dehydrogenase family)